MEWAYFQLALGGVMKATGRNVQFNRSMRDDGRSGSGVPRPARALLVVAWLVGCVMFSGAANAACNPRGNSPVKVSNWTQFLKQGLLAPSPAPASGQGA